MPHALLISPIDWPEILDASFMSYMTVYAVLGIVVTSLLWAGVYWRPVVKALLPLSALAFIGCIAKLV